MELALNLVWFLLSLLTIAWFIRNRAVWSHRDRLRAAVALCLVVMFLLPVISMTDDLLAARFPAEVEQMQSLHKVQHVLASLAPVSATLYTITPLAAAEVPTTSASHREALLPAPHQQSQGFRSTHGIRPPLSAARA